MLVGDIAILVLGANAPRILGRSLKHFDDPRFRFFLHVDKKIDRDEYLREMGAAERVTLINPSIAVFWGGFTMIEAELALIRAALADPNISSFAIWSDDTAPLRSPEHTFRSLTERPDRIEAEVLPHVQDWYWQFYFNDSRLTNPLKMDVNLRTFGPKQWQTFQRMQRLVERGKYKLDKVLFSRQWIALGRSSAQTILDYADSNEHLVESLRFSLFPDEIFFPNLYKLCFPQMEAFPVPVHANYHTWPAPHTYSRPEEIPALERVPRRLFLRKLPPTAVELVDFVVSRWS